MSTVSNTNKACCTIPPVHSDYTPNGSFKSYGGFDKVYVTGPETSENAIICVYDIFGFFPQTQQGADIIACSLKTRVLMPDFFEPDESFPISRFPPKTEDDGKLLQTFFRTTASPPKSVAKLKALAEALKADNVKRIGVYGFCWGAKVAIGVGSETSLFDSVSMVHPAMLSVDDATKLAMPVAVYISKDEDAEEYNKIVKVITEKPFAAKSDYKIYSTMFHGWAAARGNLNDEENNKQYKDVYANLIKFFSTTLA